ncbi:hypothetical protein D1007_30143 [Hordeum vulgare]|nr:hypothetical protein D1007_30143 [Hordeum vulgare]
MAGSFSSSSCHSSGTTPPLIIVKVEPQETSKRRHSRGVNLIKNEGRRQPSPPRGHLRLVRPNKEPLTPLVVEQEHAEMVANLDTDLKWPRDDYVRNEMKRQRRALEEIAARCRGRKKCGVLILSDSDEEMSAQTAPILSDDLGQGWSKDVDAGRRRQCTLLEKNITRSIPKELTKLSALVELKLDGNLFSGGIPDFSGCRNLQYIFFTEIELLHLLIPTIAETVVLAAPAKKLGSYFSEVATATTNRFALSEIEDVTDKFERRIGSGGFGIVYYGKQAREQESCPDEQHRAWLSPLHRGSLLPREHGR